jgi:ribonuclease P protein component
LKKYGLSAAEKIKSRKEFERIFTQGETIYSSKNILKANYKLELLQNATGIFFAVAVSKKLGNAVWRNRIKRLIREAYRLNKICLVEKCNSNNALLKIIFSPQALNQKKNKCVGFSEIEFPLKEIIANLNKKI